MAQVTEVCEELDKVLLEFMSTLQELSQLREQYAAAVKEVRSIKDARTS